MITGILAGNSIQVSNTSAIGQNTVQVAGTLQVGLGGVYSTQLSTGTCHCKSKILFTTDF